MLALVDAFEITRLQMEEEQKATTFKFINVEKRKLDVVEELLCTSGVLMCWSMDQAK
jgi:hypothetical protein